MKVVSLVARGVLWILKLALEAAKVFLMLTGMTLKVVLAVIGGCTA